MAAQTVQTIAPVEEPVVEETPAPTPKMTVREYLELERASRVRHEYVDGEIFAMSGETPDHNRIARNTVVLLENAFTGRPCESFIENVRVRVNPTQYRYPDLSALCGGAEFTDENPPALLNPSLVVEVLSPSTERLDREDKFSEYRRMESVIDYLLIAQDRMEATQFARQSASQWLVTIHTAPDARIVLESVGVTLTLAELYRKTPLASPPAA
jgi:Uma2 family endonuclease